MYKILNMIAVFTITFTIIVPDHVIADTSSQRDAVYASEDKPHGNGAARDAHIKDSSDVRKSDVGSLAKADNQSLQPKITGIENTCAWSHEGFRKAYLKSVSTKIGWLEENEPNSQELPKLKARYSYLSALASNTANEALSGDNSEYNNYNDLNDIVQGASISQNTHNFTSGYDSSAYHMQSISIQQDIEYVAPSASSSCQWISDSNIELKNKGKEQIFNNEFAVVFPMDYTSYSYMKYNGNSYNYTFPCKVPLIFFCAKDIYLSGNSFSRFGGNNKNIYGKANIFFAGKVDGYTVGDRHFNYIDSNVYIHNGNSKLGDYSFINVSGDIVIGDGSFTLGYGSFLKHSYDSIKTCNVIIGNGNHSIGDLSFSDFVGNITIGNGIHKFGSSCFNNIIGDIFIGDADAGYGHTFGYGNFDYIGGGNIIIGRGNHSFGHQSFGGGRSSYDGKNKVIKIGDGNQNFGSNVFTSTGMNIEIGNGDIKFSDENNGCCGPFYNTKGNITIGIGKHELLNSYGAFKGSEGIITIGDGDFISLGSGFLHKAKANIEIGKGNKSISGSQSFQYMNGRVTLKEGNFNIQASNVFDKFTGNIDIGYGEHIITGLSNVTGDITIKGNCEISKAALLNVNGDISIGPGIIKFYYFYNGYKTYTDEHPLYNYKLDASDICDQCSTIHKNVK